MIDYATYCQIRSLHTDEKLTAGQIARKLQLDRKTVRYWIGHDYHQAPRPNRASKLDPYKPLIKGWLEKHEFTAQQILQKLRQEGLQVGYTIVREYVQLIRPKPAKAYLTLHFAPAECMQVDWGSWGFIPVGSTRRRLSFYAAVLCYSRMMYLEFTLGQSQEHFLSCHQNAFNYFGGLPDSVMVDNCKTAVLSHPIGQPPVFNPHYLDFARHYGFKIRACGVKKANEKGRVENGVGYVKHNLLRGLELPPWLALNPEARHWLDTIANIRIHAHTRRTPLELFADEKPRLRPLPQLPYDTARVCTLPVNSRFRVIVDTNRYSVPANLAGTLLTKTSKSPSIAALTNAIVTSSIPITPRRCWPSVKELASSKGFIASSASVRKPRNTTSNSVSAASMPAITSRKSWLWLKSTARTKSSAPSRTPVNTKLTAANTSPTFSNNADASCPNPARCTSLARQICSN
jgi:transposase